MDKCVFIGKNRQMYEWEFQNDIAYGFFTFGKIYTKVEEWEHGVKIYDDNNDPVSFFRDGFTGIDRDLINGNFISLGEYRELKLKKLGI